MSIDRSALRDTMRGHGADLVSAKNDTALDALFDATARLTKLLDDGKIPSAFVTQLAEWVDETVDSAEAGRPGPQISNVGNGANSIKPEYRRVIHALDRGELTLDPSTGLPQAADSSADVDNALVKLEKKLGLNKVVGDTPDDRVNRLLAELDNTNTTNTDQLGKVAEALGLPKNAKHGDIVTAAKALKDGDQELRDSIKSATGVDANSGETTKDYMVRALAATPTGTPAPGRRGFGRGR